MLDFRNFITTPDYDVQLFTGGSYNYPSGYTDFADYQVWHKPSMARMIYMIGVGGGGSGGWSANTANAAGGGGGGAAGSTTVGFIPAIHFPDVLYMSIGQGGQVYANMAASSTGTTTANGQAGVNGHLTIVTTNPAPLINLAALTYIYPNGGGGGGGGNTTTGGAGGSNLASGSGQLFAKGVGRIYGQGSSGGTGGVPGAVGLSGAAIAGMWGGCGGGGASNGSVVGVGGAFSGPEVNGYWPTFFSNTVGGAAASGATPAGNGQDGFTTPFFRIAVGGSGGGGDSNTAGGQAGNGGFGGYFGCGGGGAGGSTLNNALAIPGCGADGLVLIVAW